MTSLTATNARLVVTATLLMDGTSRLEAENACLRQNTGTAIKPEPALSAGTQGGDIEMNPQCQMCPTKIQQNKWGKPEHISWINNIAQHAKRSVAFAKVLSRNP